MSKKISLKKLGQLDEKSKVTTKPTKGVVIREKRPREEVLDTSSNKRGNITDNSKGKEAMPLPKAKKKKSSKLASRETRPAAPGEGTLTKPSNTFGPMASVVGSP